MDRARNSGPGLPRVGRRSSTSGARWGITMAALLVACTPPIKQYEIRDPGLSCAQANRYAHDTLTGMGFSITRFDPAATGRSGSVRGTREVSGRGRQNVTVRIDCGAGGVTIDAAEDGKLLGQIDFKRGYYMSFVSVRSMDEGRAKMEQRVAAGTAPASLQRTDIRVLVEPLRGQSARLDFDFDVAAAGVLPVRVRISNMTELHYDLEPGDIRLTRADGQRVTALSAAAAAGQISAARMAGTGEPVTTASREEVTERLREKGWTARALPPRSEAAGFLYFPLADYTRARVVLTETESGETEGFMVEF